MFHEIFLARDLWQQLLYREVYYYTVLIDIKEAFLYAVIEKLKDRLLDRDKEVVFIELTLAAGVDSVIKATLRFTHVS